MSVLAVDQWPSLSDPVLVYSFRGWVDAGSAGEGTTDALVEQLRTSGGTRFATIDLTDLLDLQQVRPLVRLVDGVTREISFPEIELWSGNLGRDLVVVRGPEPSIRWSEFVQTIVEVAAHLDVREAYGLGGMPAIASHRRPVEVLASATRRSVAQEIGPLRADYFGATGLNTVVQSGLGEIEVRSVGLWAQVPQYVAGSPSPPAVRALLSRLAQSARLTPDFAAIDHRAAAYRDQVESGLAERPEVLAFVDRIDRELDAQVPSGDALVDEIEEFLRSRPESDD